MRELGQELGLFVRFMVNIVSRGSELKSTKSCCAQNLASGAASVEYFDLTDLCTQPLTILVWRIDGTFHSVPTLVILEKGGSQVDQI